METAGREAPAYRGPAPVLAARRLAGAPPGVAECVFREFSLDLERGDWIAVTGENGAGKTTLALTLAGLWPARAGAIELGNGANDSAPGEARVAGAVGTDTPRESRDAGLTNGTRDRVRSGNREAGFPAAAHQPKARARASARLATILQEPASQITQRTVRDEIAFIALNLGASDEGALHAADRWAARFGLESLLECAPHLLSAGEQQLVLLAQALASEPDVLIADEAAAHLDAVARRQLFEILRSQLDAGLALLWITQEPAELEQAGRVLTLQAGDRPSSALAAGDEARFLEDPAQEGSVHRDRALLRAVITPGDGPGRRIRCEERIELSIGSNGAWAIVGPNGSGKSSLLEVLAGVEALPEVELSWAAPPVPAPLLVGQYPERQIFEERVGSELLFAASRRGRDPGQARAEALRLCAAMGYDERFLERRCWTLSAGEKRLVSLIGAFIAPARLLLLDEPTCGIDPCRRTLLADWLRRLARRGPVVMASQDLGWIREVGAIEVSLSVRKPPNGLGLDRKPQVSAKKRIDRSV